jgi:hypothetical protein
MTVLRTTVLPTEGETWRVRDGVVLRLEATPPPTDTRDPPTPPAPVASVAGFKRAQSPVRYPHAGVASTG